MDTLEAWLREHDIAIVGQAATGSGEMVRLQLRLVDGSELQVALSASILVERPQSAIDEVAARLEEHTRTRNYGNGH